MSPVTRLHQWTALASAGARLGWQFLFARRRFRPEALFLSFPAPTRQEYRRMLHYHMGSTYLAALFGALRGSPLRPSERQRFQVMAALSGLFDDTSERFRTDTPHPLESYAAQFDPEGRCLHLLRRLEADLPEIHEPHWRSQLRQLFRLETQRDPGGAVEEKGAIAVLLFRQLLDHPLPDAERSAWMAFGRYIQACDDLFDCWSDLQNGQRTTATTCLSEGDPVALARHVSERLSAARNAILATPYPMARRKAALAVLHFLSATARVCTAHYIKLAKKHGTLPLDDRSAMVVDMDRWSNRRRAAWHLLYEPPW